MAKLTIYSTNGYQSEPEPTEATEADGRLAKYIDQSVRLVVDSESRTAVAYFRAKSSVVRGRRPANYYAEYTAEEGESPLFGLLDALRRLEADGTGDHDWTFIQDKPHFEYLWQFDRESDVSLRNLGLSWADETAVVELLRSGEQLEFGVDSYETARRAVEALAGGTDQSNPSLAVAERGRISAVEHVDVVLAPGSGAKFAPLTESTQAALEECKTRLEEPVRDTYHGELMDGLDTLVDGEESVWRTYRDLGALETYVGSLWSEETKDVSLGPDAQYVAKVAYQLRTDASVVDLPPPKLLEPGTKAEIRDDVLGRIREEREAIGAEMQTRVREEFEAAVDAIDDRDEPAATRRALDAALDLVDGRELSVEGVPDAVGRLSTLLEQLESNDGLDAAERREVRQWLRDELERRRDELVRERRNHLLQRFDRAIERADGSDESTATVVKRAVRLLDGEEHIETSPAVRGFSEALSLLESDGVLDGGERESLRVEFRQRLEDWRSKRRDQRAAHHRNRLATQAGELAVRRDDDTPADVYERLDAAKRRCSSTPEADRRVDDEVRRFAELVAKLNGDRLVPSRTAEEIRDDVRWQLERSMAELERTRYEELSERLQTGLERYVDGRVEAEGPNPVFDDLDHIEAILEDGVSGGRPRSDSPLSDLYETLERIVDGDAENVLNASRRGRLRETVRAELDRYRAALRSKERDRLAAQFESHVDDLASFDLAPEHRLTLLERVKAHVETRNPPSDSPLSSEDVKNLTEAQRDQLKRRYRSLIQQAKSPDDDGVLLRQEKDELEGEFVEALTAAIDDCRQEYVAALRTELESAIETRLTEGDERTPDEVQDNIDWLEALADELTPGRSAGVELGDPEASLVGEINKEGPLDPDDREAIRDAVKDTIESKIEALKRKRETRRLELLRGAVNDIDDNDDRPLVERIGALREFDQLADPTLSTGGTTTPQMGNYEVAAAGRGSSQEWRYLESGDADTIREHVEQLPTADREVLQEEIAEKREAALARYQQSVAATVGANLDRYIQHGQNPHVGIDSLYDALVGKRNLPAADSQDDKHFATALRQVQAAVDAASNEAITDNERKRVLEATKEKVAARRGDGEHSTGGCKAAGVAAGGGATASSRGKGNAGRGDTSDTSDTSDGEADDAPEGSIRDGLLKVAREKPSMVVFVAFLLVMFALLGGAVALALTGTGLPGLTGGGGAAPAQLTVDAPTWNATVGGGTLTVKADTTASQYNVSLYDTSGTLVADASGAVESGSVDEQLSVPGDGTYFLVVTAGGSSSTSELLRITVEGDGAAGGSDATVPTNDSPTNDSPTNDSTSGN